MTPRGAKRHRPFAEAGVAAIEFALIAPTFLIMMFGLVVWGVCLGDVGGPHPELGVAGVGCQSRKSPHPHLQPVTPRCAKRHQSFAEAGVVALERPLSGPIGLRLMFGIVVYGFDFGTRIALAHAASEGARASVAGITAGERANLAETQVRVIFARYPPLLSSESAHIEVAAAPASHPTLFKHHQSVVWGTRGSIRGVPRVRRIK